MKISILGMFRDDKETLASDLADFIYKIVHGNGVNIDNRFEILSILMVVQQIFPC